MFLKEMYILVTRLGHPKHDLVENVETSFGILRRPLKKHVGQKTKINFGLSA